eukprot:jgi/Tetstr1/424845/TSEL_015348.t1
MWSAPAERVGSFSSSQSTRTSADGSESDVEHLLEHNDMKSLNEEPAQEDLEQEPWFITLRSAGVRVKGRSRKELLAVVEKIKKRRRESAARSRAKKAGKIHTLTAENDELRRENDKLKQLVSKLLAERGSDLAVDNLVASAIRSKDRL